MTTTGTRSPQSGTSESATGADAAELGPAPPTSADATDLSSAFDREVQRRATRLCVPAEPHTEAWPCAKHLREARGQLSSPLG